MEDLIERRSPLLVLGLGNLLLSDDGLGLELLAVLRRAHGGDDAIEFLDGGTQGTALLGELEGRQALLIVDAVAGDEPGAVVRVDDPLTWATPAGLGGHGANASGLLAAALLVGWLPKHVVVVGVTPSSLDTGIGLSAVVRDALPRAMEVAETTLAEFGRSLDVESEHGGALCTS